MNEDELRAAMQAHNGDAPHAAEFAPRPVHRRPALPIAAAIVITAAVVTLLAVVWNRPSHGQRAAISNPTGSNPRSASSEPSSALTCPHRYNAPADENYGTVPSHARGFDAAARLAPPITPTTVVVCAYPTRPGKASELQASRQVDAGLDNVTNGLAWAGPPWPSTVCAGVAMKPSPTYLIGITYRHARVWVSLPGLVGGCSSGASNGAYDSSFHDDTSAQHALSSGRWPDSTLHPGRLGQQRQVVPGNPTALTIRADIVRRTYRQDKRHPGRTRTMAAGFGSLVAALNSATARKSTGSCSHSPQPGARTYELTFGYRVGPPVAINIMQGCVPEVDNGSLQIRDGQQFFARIESLLRLHS